LPGGAPCPSARTSMSQPATCSGVATWPTPYWRGASFFCASAGVATASSATHASLTHLNILELPAGFERPGLDAVVVIDRIDPADLTQRILGGLHVAALVHGARLQQQLLAGPLEIRVEAHAGLVVDRPVDARRAPVAAAIERDVDALDLAATGPGEPGDDVEALLLERRLRRRRGDDRLCIHYEGELARFAVLHQVGVFRGLLAREPRLVADLDAAQPLDPHIAFPTGHDEANGIALLRTQHFAVHAIGDDAIVERLGERNGAVHAGGVAAFRHHPFGGGLHARL